MAPIYEAEIEDPTTGALTQVTASSESELEAAIEAVVASSFPEKV